MFATAVDQKIRSVGTSMGTCSSIVYYLEIFTAESITPTYDKIITNFLKLIYCVMEFLYHTSTLYLSFSTFIFRKVLTSEPNIRNHTTVT
jgi:hypothetical protein